MNIRAKAALVLRDVLYHKQSFHDVLSNAKLDIIKSNIKNTKDAAFKDTAFKDAAFLQALCFGVLRVYFELQFYLKKLIPKPIPDKDNDLFFLMCVGLYQLSYMRTAKHAAVSETVSAVNDLKKSWAKGFVNGVLRSYQRKESTLKEAFEQSTKTDMEAYYSHPLWLIDLIQKYWPEHYTDILKNNNLHPPLTLRVNERKISRDKYLEYLKENLRAQLSKSSETKESNEIKEPKANNEKAQPLTATIIPETKQGLTIENPQEIPSIPGFKEGLFYVQDAALQFVPDLLELAPNLRVLDACAAPGGKSSHILEVEPKTLLISLDSSPERTKAIQENFDRLDLSSSNPNPNTNTNTNPHILIGDATKPATWWDKKPFDRILVDAPCSSTGVIRRHPDIKFLRDPKDFRQYGQKQLALLKALWPLLKPGGILLYTTCSIIPIENEDVVETFLKENSDANLSHFTLPVGIPLKYGHQILPGQHNMDGFYYARIEKKSV